MLLLDYGFRPFFLGAGLYAVLSVAAWGLHLAGIDILAGDITTSVWHAHEMLFGYAGAAMTGFLLTASPNWTGRPRLSGWPLGVLFGLWLVGRVAMWLGGVLPYAVVAIADMAFVPALASVMMVTLTGHMKRQGLVMGVLTAIMLANTVFHLSVLDVIDISANRALLITLDAYILLIAIIGGRIVPNFTANHLRRTGDVKNMRHNSSIEKLVIVTTIAVLLFDMVDIEHTALIAGLAGILHLIRMSGWRSFKTFDSPLVWSLHVGYLWIPIGFLLKAGAEYIDFIDTSASIHALSIGAVATLTLAVMTRASLGHTGRALAATPLTTVAYVLVTGAALLRVFAALDPTAATDWAYSAAAIAWVGAFGAFCVAYVPMYLSPRVDS